jgi:hypothetical protein
MPAPVELRDPLGELVGTRANMLAVGSRLITAEAEFSRPADTNAYAARDVVSNNATASTLMALPVARIAGGDGYLVRARLVTNRATDTARFRLWLYRIANPTVPADNAAMTLLWANRTSRIGWLDFAALASEQTGSDSAAALIADARLAFACAEGETRLWGLLQALDAFTPASGQQFFVQLVAEVN